MTTTNNDIAWELMSKEIDKLEVKLGLESNHVDTIHEGRIDFKFLVFFNNDTNTNLTKMRVDVCTSNNFVKSFKARK